MVRDGELEDLGPCGYAMCGTRRACDCCRRAGNDKHSAWAVGEVGGRGGAWAKGQGTHIVRRSLVAASRSMMWTTRTAFHIEGSGYVNPNA